MTSKYAKDTLVILATGVTTLVTCIALAFVDLTMNFSLYGFMPSSGEATKQKDSYAASQLQLRYCKNCLRHHIRVVLERREKNDWKAVPNTEAEFETAAQFHPSFVTP